MKEKTKNFIKNLVIERIQSMSAIRNPKDSKYDFIIPIKYNFKKPRIGKGSAIFLHVTKDYKPTAGCIAIQKKDFLILLKLINKNSKIKII